MYLNYRNPDLYSILWKKNLLTVKVVQQPVIWGNGWAPFCLGVFKRRLNSDFAQISQIVQKAYSKTSTTHGTVYMH